MRLLVVTQYFWPESFLINDLVRTLREQGHSVVVATGKPNYPDGTIFDGYTASGTQTERFADDIEVVRVPLRPRGRAGSLSLALNYLSFVWSGLRYFPSLLDQHEFDVILSYVPSPLTASIPAIALKRRKKAHLAIWVQDLWPESLAATGHVRNRAMLALAGLVVRAIYKGADTLLVQSHAFQGPVGRYAARDKIEYYPNSMRLTDSADSEAQLPAELLSVLTNHFCVVFAGNVGSVQSIPTIVDAAVLLKDLEAVRVVIIGSGSMSEWMEQRKAELGLENLIIAGRLPPGAMPSVYRRSRALVVTLNNEDALARTIPSKVQAYLGAGRPIVAALPGEGARVVSEADAGITCPPEDPEALAGAIRTLYLKSDSERDAMGAAGKRYFTEHFEMTSQTRRLIEILTERTEGKGGRS